MEPPQSCSPPPRPRFAAPPPRPPLTRAGGPRSLSRPVRGVWLHGACPSNPVSCVTLRAPLPSPLFSSESAASTPSARLVLSLSPLCINATHFHVSCLASALGWLPLSHPPLLSSRFGLCLASAWPLPGRATHHRPPVSVSCAQGRPVSPPVAALSGSRGDGWQTRPQSRVRVWAGWGGAWCGGGKASLALAPLPEADSRGEPLPGVSLLSLDPLS